MTNIKKKKQPPSNALSARKKKSLGERIWRDRYLLLLFLPCLIYYILFKYVPMYGALVAFKDFKPFIGFMGSPWVGLEHFRTFFASPDAWRLIRNTLLLGLYTLLWSFPLPIIFALALNEIHNAKFKKVVQTVSYMPHFLSAVVVCGMVTSFLDPVRGAVNLLIKAFGGNALNFLAEPAYFRTIYVISEVWQTLGWSGIVYLAAISGVDPGYYEAATLDGASRLRQIWSITLPSIAPTVVTMLILRVGHVMNMNLEKVLLLQSPVTYEVSDVITTFVYRSGISNGQISYSTAVGLFSSVVNLILLVIANTASKRIADTGIF